MQSVLVGYSEIQYLLIPIKKIGVCLCLLIIGFLYFPARVYGQVNPLKMHLNSIVEKQLFFDLEVNEPIFIYAPGVFFYTESTRLNYKFLLEDKQEKNQGMGMKELVFSEFTKVANIDFFSDINSDSALLVRAFSTQRHLFDLKTYQQSEESFFVLEIPEQKFKLEKVYTKNKLIRTTISKRSLHEFVDYAYQQDTLMITRYNMANMKYQLSLEVGKDGKITNLIDYRKSKNRSDRKIKNVTSYRYDDHSKLQSEEKRNRKGRILRTTEYHYEGDFLSAVVTHSDDIMEASFMQYNDAGKLVQKDYLFDEHTYHFYYKYTENDRLESFKVCDEDEWINREFVFIYNQSGQLITLNVIDHSEIREMNHLKNSFAITYNEMGRICVLRKLDASGRIIKEVNYEWHEAGDE